METELNVLEHDPSNNNLSIIRQESRLFSQNFIKDQFLKSLFIVYVLEINYFK